MASSTSTLIHVLTLALLATTSAAQQANTFKYVGLSGVSAQQLFLGTKNKVYIVDKTENNNDTVNGHPAWASEYDLTTNSYRTMEVVSNSFCAGGTVLGNGTWINVGGNEAVTTGGVKAASQKGGPPYQNIDGGMAMRFLDPCDDQSCDWLDDAAMYMTSRRWYPTLETLEDGSAMIFGGCEYGGYVNDGTAPQPGDWQNNPTVEYWPANGREPFTLQFLLNTLPVNLFPLVWLLPSGNMLIQAEFQAMIFDYKNALEYNIANIPDAVRVYPASAATAVFPMTPTNNWTATIIFCGGTNLNNLQWKPGAWLVSYPADTSCVTISPDVDLNWYHDDPLAAGRSMGQFINLPDGRLFMLNGAGKGTAGYGQNDWAIGQSYADDPQLQSWYFDPSQAPGSRWSQAASSSIPRMYHSSATLLADGSVLVSGSNPNADFVDHNTDPNAVYVTQYQVEIFYPDYWDKPRPAPTGMPDRITYGGNSFDIELTLADLNNNALNINATKAVIIRTGFSTHAMNMGQRHIELRTSFTGKDDGSATLHVAQLPPNPAILVPGPALFFVVVNGVPSEASWIMVGDGIIGDQTLQAESTLPPSTLSAQIVAQYGGAASKREAQEAFVSDGWRWDSKWSLRWDWAG